MDHCHDDNGFSRQESRILPIDLLTAKIILTDCLKQCMKLLAGPVLTQMKGRHATRILPAGPSTEPQPQYKLDNILVVAFF